MQPVISSAHMREIDRLTTERRGIPSFVLMESAAAAAASVATEWSPGALSGKSVLVLCGRGNNGGDGAATARLLTHKGMQVDVVLLGKLTDTNGDARLNFEKVRDLSGEGSIRFFECTSEKEWAALLKSELMESYELIVDALFGTGLTRPVEGLPREVVRHVNQHHKGDESACAQIISIDIPSGLNSDSAQLIGDAVKANVTITMTAPKIANVLPPASNYNGKLIIADIGSPPDLIQQAKTQLFISEEEDARRWLIQTRYNPDSYKHRHGHALVIAGSRGFTGAAALCGNAAMRSGAGLVTVATPLSAQPAVAAQVMPEVMTTALAETDRGAVSDEAINYAVKFSERADVLAIGPGLSAEDERTRFFVRAVVEQRGTPVVIDADGLNCLAPWPSELRGAPDDPIVLTPHPGEMLRLLGTNNRAALDDRIAVSREFATAHRVILVLKGERTLIAAPDGRVFVNPTGNPGLGTAGAGDTLTGVIAGFLAQAYATLKNQADALGAVIAAVYVSSLAGDLAAGEFGMRAMTASDIREHLSQAICMLDPFGETPPSLHD